MNGTSTIAWRKYEAAVDRLRKIMNQVDTPEATATALSRITIGVVPDRDAQNGHVATLVQAVGEAIKADLSKYLTAAIHRTQDDVTTAANDLRAAIDADLKHKFMRD